MNKKSKYQLSTKKQLLHYLTKKISGKLRLHGKVNNIKTTIRAYGSREETVT